MAASEHLLLELTPSRQHQAGLVLLHLLAYTAVVVSDIPFPGKHAVFFVLLLSSLVYYLCRARGTCRMVLTADGECTLLDRFNRDDSIMSLTGSYCGLVTILTLSDPLMSTKTRQLIHADALNVSELKKLKQMLKVRGQ